MGWLVLGGGAGVSRCEFRGSGRGWDRRGWGLMSARGFGLTSRRGSHSRSKYCACHEIQPQKFADSGVLSLIRLSFPSLMLINKTSKSTSGGVHYIPNQKHSLRKYVGHRTVRSGWRCCQRPRLETRHASGMFTQYWYLM